MLCWRNKLHLKLFLYNKIYKIFPMNSIYLKRFILQQIVTLEKHTKTTPGAVKIILTC